ncbi:MAG: putative lipid II flippase FtsW [Victivallaceae bacterium]|nr:putative lipid II flippase FtsW [Victivallaceae bacterium]
MNLSRRFMVPCGGEKKDAANVINTQTPPVASWVVLLVVSMIMLGAGLATLYSATYGTVGTLYFNKQLLWSCVGMVLAAFAICLRYDRLASWSGWMTIAIAIMLLAADFCFGSVKGGARWIRLGPVSIQPSEFAKVVVGLFVAKYCYDYPRTFGLLRHRNGLLPCVAVVAVLCGLVFLGHDLGTTLLILGVSVLTLFVAGLPLRYFSAMPVLLAGFSVYVYFDRVRMARAVSFLDPEAYQNGKGYQLWKGLLALGSGGWFGLGFKNSRMKMKYLPENHTDFVLCIFGEEFGFIGMALVIAMYVTFGVCCWRIAVKARTLLGRYVVYAMSSAILLQALINMLVISASIPTKGMPAPFFSYGGSNMLSSLLELGIILSVGLDSIYPDYMKRRFITD